MEITETKEWWKESVVYQIYPRSFQDSNGDGIGDIRGIIERLPYLKDLGINVIWLCPVYKSPMDDGGYDISDYYEIDPMFGTMSDMDELIEKAEKLGIKILMDLVVNHTSDEHEWFEKAIADPKSKYRDYYIFREGVNGNPPNNWRSYFGGSAWEAVPGEENMFYLHAFSKKQPDLNWENIVVRNECIQMINWWLEKGLGGFRIDAILNLKKRIEYGTFPADGEDGLVFIGHWILNQPGIEEWLKEIDERFKNSEWTVKELKEKIITNELVTQRNGWGAKYLENHDQPRSINKYLPQEYQDDRSKKMLGTLFMMLHGTPFIYQGQEIGMSNTRMESIDDYNDIATHDQYHRAILSGMSPEEALEGMYRRSRDNSRTPMQWNNQKNAGFSDSDEIWLKANPNYLDINVEQEQIDDNSVLNFYKKLIHLRSDSSKYKEVAVYGELLPVESSDEVIAYKRKTDDAELLIIVNFSDSENQLCIEGTYEQVLANVALPEMVENVLEIPAYTGAVFSRVLEVD
ncbi:alpha-glucosidase [Listeria monocytogenes]|uniref:alpha-glucosidase n=1 Tax=Listeria monocytogenes TaxID=1639 RepID=UPI004035EB9C